eukprot:3997817-Prorocentrum_lima.AAC.1
MTPAGILNSRQLDAGARQLVCKELHTRGGERVGGVERGCVKGEEKGGSTTLRHEVARLVPRGGRGGR